MTGRAGSLAASMTHVRWVGGGSGAGKTTVTRLLAERYGVAVHGTDATIGDHSARLGPAAAPLLERFRRMTVDERWVDRDPRTMLATFPWFRGEGFDLVLEDLRRVPADRPVVAEGFRLLPRLVRPHLADARHGVWLLPTPAFRRAAFARRGPAEAFWTRTADPDRALANLLERDRLFTDELAAEARRAGLAVLPVDGTRTPGQTADDLAERFGLEPAGPGCADVWR